MAERLFVIVGAIVAVILQIVLAPYIAIGSGMPNFVVIFAVVVAVAAPHSYGCVLPFVLGLAFDLTCGGPVGAMAFSLTLFTFLLARYFEHIGNDSLFMSLAFIALGVLLVELSYGIFLLLFGFNASFFEALAYRIAPCFVYDLVVAFVLFPLVGRFVQPAGVTRTDITQLR